MSKQPCFYEKYALFSQCQDRQRKLRNFCLKPRIRRYGAPTEEKLSLSRHGSFHHLKLLLDTHRLTTVLMEERKILLADEFKFATYLKNLADSVERYKAVEYQII